MRIYVITAVGVGIDTETHLADEDTKAEKIAKELIEDFKIDKEDLTEMCMHCWKGYSKKAQCDVEIEIHTHDLWLN